MRKRLVQLIGVVATAAFIVAACAPQATEAPAAPAEVATEAPAAAAPTEAPAATEAPAEAPAEGVMNRILRRLTRPGDSERTGEKLSGVLVIYLLQLKPYRFHLFPDR